jgi:hypothetical protein
LASQYIVAGSWDFRLSYPTQPGNPEEYLKAIQLIPNNGSNIKTAEEQIAPAIELFLKSINKFIKRNKPNISPKTKIDLVSHSMGALSTRRHTANVRTHRVRVWLSSEGSRHGTNALCQWDDEEENYCCPAYANNLNESRLKRLSKMITCVNVYDSWQKLKTR